MPVNDLERALRNTTKSLNYYRAELQRESAHKRRFAYIKNQITALELRCSKLEREIESARQENQ